MNSEIAARLFPVRCLATHHRGSVVIFSCALDENQAWPQREESRENDQLSPIVWSGR